MRWTRAGGIFASSPSCVRIGCGGRIGAVNKPSTQKCADLYRESRKGAKRAGDGRAMICVLRLRLGLRLPLLTCLRRKFLHCLSPMRSTLPPSLRRDQRTKRRDEKPSPHGMGEEANAGRWSGGRGAHWKGPLSCPGILMGANSTGMAADATTASGSRPELITRWLPSLQHTPHEKLVGSSSKVAGSSCN